MKIGILGAAGYTGGELIRLLLNHPEAEIVFANSESNAGNLVSDVHEGLIGETDLRFTDQMPFEDVDVVFFCFGHGKSEAFLKEHTIPAHVKIIDLAQDFRIKGDHDYVYGLPEINKEEILKAQHVANPGCFATCIQVALLPAAYLNLLKEDVAVNAITGSTGAGQKPGATTHFSWRNNNLSIYKPFQHQHIAEIRQSLKQVQGYLDADIDFIPYRGDFARGIFLPRCRLHPLQRQTDRPEAGGEHQQGPRPCGEVRPEAARHLRHRQPPEGRRRPGRPEHESHVWHRRDCRSASESLSLLNSLGALSSPSF